MLPRQWSVACVDNVKTKAAEEPFRICNALHIQGGTSSPFTKDTLIDEKEEGGSAAVKKVPRHWCKRQAGRLRS